MRAPHRAWTLAVAITLAAGALLPVAEGAHYSLYSGNPLTQAAYGTFEGNDKGAVPHGNQNGPAGQEKRAIPAQPDIPVRFHGLADTLVGSHNLVDNATTTWGGGIAIMDHYMYGSAVEAGQLVAYGYFLSDATGAPRSTPTSMHALWFGKWDDVNGDGIINDEHCGTQHIPCSATDEFVWRGRNTDAAEGRTAGNLSAVSWFFPGDYDGSLGAAAWHGSSALSGHCGDHPQTPDNPHCLNPRADMDYYDGTPDGAGNSRWVGNNGGGQLTPEESLVVSQHIVTLLGPTWKITDPASAEGYRVEATSADGAYRDYDWYDSVADDDVEALYLTTLRAVRDCVDLHSYGRWDWLPPVYCAPETPVPVPPEVDTALHCVSAYLSWFGPGCCPRALPGEFGLVGEPTGCYDKDTNAHNEAVAGTNANGSSHLKVWAAQVFQSVVPAYASTPSPAQQNAVCNAAAGANCPATAPKQGFFGDFWVDENLLMPHSDYAYGAWIRPALTAWYWNDGGNGKPADGRIGTYNQDLEDAYNAGLADNPNNGLCDIQAGNRCELIPASSVYAGKLVRVGPGPSGWPPGTFKMNSYEDNWEGPPMGVGPEPWLEEATPMFATNTVDLRVDSPMCKATSFSCRTKDAIFIPTGSAFELHGRVVGDITFAWSEGDQTYAVTWDTAWEASI